MNGGHSLTDPEEYLYKLKTLHQYHINNDPHSLVNCLLNSAKGVPTLDRFFRINRITFRVVTLPDADGNTDKSDLVGESRNVRKEALRSL